MAKNFGRVFFSVQFRLLEIVFYFIKCLFFEFLGFQVLPFFVFFQILFGYALFVG